MAGNPDFDYAFIDARMIIPTPGLSMSLTAVLEKKVIV